jgi:hypothetical protein
MMMPEAAYAAQTRRKFIRDTAATLAASACFASPALRAAEAALNPDNSGVPATRLARLATGANVTLWFRYPRSETADHFANYIPDSEAGLMSQIGLKHVRL